MEKLRIGTCSWKYDSWKGIVYPETGDFNYLEEYSKHFNSVEIDQWFWSLFGADTIRLPELRDVRSYLESVPDDFKFTIKIPNSITLTHFYTHGKPKSAPITVNPHFLSLSMMDNFLKRIEPFGKHIGMLMFQFEYLNIEKMPSQKVFIEQFGQFLTQLERKYTYAVEIRNPNYLNSKYFEFLNHNNVCHVFVQGYYMPLIKDVYKKYAGYIHDATVIRLMGTDRPGIEERVGNKWNTVVTPKDNELPEIVDIIRSLQERKIETYVNVNNHYEGSAPLTIQKIKQLLK